MCKCLKTTKKRNEKRKKKKKGVLRRAWWFVTWKGRPRGKKREVVIPKNVETTLGTWRISKEPDLMYTFGKQRSICGYSY